MQKPDPKRRLLMKFALGSAAQVALPLPIMAASESVVVSAAEPVIAAVMTSPVSSLVRSIIAGNIIHACETGKPEVDVGMASFRSFYRLQSLSSLYTLYSPRTIAESRSALGIYNNEFYGCYDLIDQSNPLLTTDTIGTQSLLDQFFQTLDEVFELSDRLARNEVPRDEIYNPGMTRPCSSFFDFVFWRNFIPYDFPGVDYKVFEDLSERQKIELLLARQMVGAANASPNGGNRSFLYNTIWFDIPTQLKHFLNEHYQCDAARFENEARLEDPHFSSTDFLARREKLHQTLDSYCAVRALKKSAAPAQEKIVQYHKAGDEAASIPDESLQIIRLSGAFSTLKQALTTVADIASSPSNDIPAAPLALPNLPTESIEQPLDISIGDKVLQPKPAL